MSTVPLTSGWVCSSLNSELGGLRQAETDSPKKEWVGRYSNGLTETCSQPDSDGTSLAAVHLAALRKRQEADRQRPLLFKLFARLKLICYQLAISLGPYMFDPWETALVLTALVGLCWLVVRSLTSPRIWEYVGESLEGAMDTLKDLYIGAIKTL